MLPRTQLEASSLELNMGLSLERGKIRLSQAHPSAWRSERYNLHPSSSGQYALPLNPVTCVGTKHRGAATVVWQSAFQNEKQSNGVLPPPLSLQSFPPFTFPKLAANPRRNCGSECCIAEHIICKLEKWYERNIFFPKGEAHSVTNPRAG